jgi:lipopolysaccharide transport system ATP-binding protein
MTKAEIRSKFDEIVAFSEVERFIDTPVKRYSSGMYVRLAFAVAAHLEPEILIVDEVLAVGDIEFQKKCLGKMKDVAGQGRTVLFVSHNMAAVLGLCPRGALLASGRLKLLGESAAVVDHYLKQNAGPVEQNGSLALITNRSGDGRLRLISFHVESIDGSRLTTILNGMDVVMVLGFECRGDCSSSALDVGISFASDQGALLTVFYSSYVDQLFRNLRSSGQFRCVIRRFALAPGTYTVGAKITAGGCDVDWPRDGIGQIAVEAGDFYGTGSRGFQGRTSFLLEGEWSVSPAGN